MQQFLAFAGITGSNVFGGGVSARGYMPPRNLSEPELCTEAAPALGKCRGDGRM